MMSSRNSIGLEYAQKQYAWYAEKYNELQAKTNRHKELIETFKNYGDDLEIVLKDKTGHGFVETLSPETVNDIIEGMIQRRSHWVGTSAYYLKRYKAEMNSWQKIVEDLQKKEQANGKI